MDTEEITDVEAFEWLNKHCSSIRIMNDLGEYVGSFQIKNNDILTAAKNAIKKLSEKNG